MRGAMPGVIKENLLRRKQRNKSKDFRCRMQLGENEKFLTKRKDKRTKNL